MQPINEAANQSVNKGARRRRKGSMGEWASRSSRVGFSWGLRVIPQLYRFSAPTSFADYPFYQ